MFTKRSIHDKTISLSSRTQTLELLHPRPRHCGFFFLNAQKIIIVLSLERAKKVAFNSSLCVTVAYLAPEICSAKGTTFLKYSGQCVIAIKTVTVEEQ